jgi:cell division septation protein DedD
VTEGNPSAIDERTFQRRRLGVLAAVLLVVLGVASLVDRPGADAGATEVATTAVDPGSQRIRIAGVGSPTAVRELLSETTTTLVAATGASTATTAPPTTTATEAPTTTEAPDEPASTVAARPDDAAEEAHAPHRTTTTSAPSTTAPPRPSSPPATTATTAPARPATTTTTAPPAPSSTSSGEQGYAYDDPRSTQVWYDLARCESGGNWSIDTGNGYYGGLQFSLATWESVGGTGYPHEHPAATQIDLGRRLQARQGWGAWPHCSEKLGLR